MCQEDGYGELAAGTVQTDPTDGITPRWSCAVQEVPLRDLSGSDRDNEGAPITGRESRQHLLPKGVSARRDRDVVPPCTIRDCRGDNRAGALCLNLPPCQRWLTSVNPPIAVAVVDLLPDEPAPGSSTAAIGYKLTLSAENSNRPGNVETVNYPCIHDVCPNTALSCARCNRDSVAKDLSALA